MVAEVHHYHQQPLADAPAPTRCLPRSRAKGEVVTIADCLPLLIASRDGRYVCSVPPLGAGQRYCRPQQSGLSSPAGGAGRSGSSPWAAYPCCYEVSAGFYQQRLDQPGGDRVVRIASGCSIPVRARSVIRLSRRRGSDNVLWFDCAFCRSDFAEAGGVGER